MARQAIDFAQSLAELTIPPDAALLESVIAEASEVLAGWGGPERPRLSPWIPGGLVRLSCPKTLIIPDLHARPRLILDLLVSVLPGCNVSVAQALATGEISVLCLGDILHSEGVEAAVRWMGATDRFIRARSVKGLLGPEMKAEMTLSLSALLITAFLQTIFPGRFFCLKGNHDNLGNISTEGDSPLGKYSQEGLMGAEWFWATYGQKAMRLVRSYELLLPLVAVGRSFCASHAEPALILGPADLLEYRARPDIVYALTWTRDGEADEGAVASSLEALLGPGSGRRFWIAGHRALDEAWCLRENDGFLQIHNPRRQQILLADETQGPASPELILYALDPEQGLCSPEWIAHRS